MTLLHNAGSSRGSNRAVAVFPTQKEFEFGASEEEKHDSEVVAQLDCFTTPVRQCSLWYTSCAKCLQRFAKGYRFNRHHGTPTAIRPCHAMPRNDDDAPRQLSPQQHLSASTLRTAYLHRQNHERLYCLLRKLLGAAPVCRTWWNRLYVNVLCQRPGKLTLRS